MRLGLKLSIDQKVPFNAPAWFPANPRSSVDGTLAPGSYPLACKWNIEPTMISEPYASFLLAGSCASCLCCLTLMSIFHYHRPLNQQLLSSVAPTVKQFKPYWWTSHFALPENIKTKLPLVAHKRSKVTEESSTTRLVHFGPLESNDFTKSETHSQKLEFHVGFFCMKSKKIKCSEIPFLVWLKTNVFQFVLERENVILAKYLLEWEVVKMIIIEVSRVNFLIFFW